MTLANRLNELGLEPHCKGGSVTLTHGYPYNPAEEETVALGIVDGSVEAHPEGADRGGYVPYVYTEDEEAYYYDGEWQEW